MKSYPSTLVTVLGLAGAILSARCSPDAAPTRFYARGAAKDINRVEFSFPPIFEREHGVSWDGQIDWKTEERARVFGAALEGSLKGISRAGSPYRLHVAVVRAEKQTGTFVVEFTIQAPSGESVEVLQVEGVCPSNRASEGLYPVVAREIVITFKKSILQ
jgi:hypothetical protein